jgi:hypothetical protein
MIVSDQISISTPSTQFVFVSLEQINMSSIQHKQIASERIYAVGVSGQIENLDMIDLSLMWTLFNETHCVSFISYFHVRSSLDQTEK